MQRDPITSSSTARDVLRLARRQQRLTQLELAERAGVSQTVVARYESGQQPTLAALERLVAACGYTLEWSLRHGDGSGTAVNSGALGTRTMLNETPIRAPFPGPIGRRLTAHLDEVLGMLASVGATNPRLYGDIADGTEGVGSSIVIGVDLQPQAVRLSLMAPSGHLGLLLDAEVRVLPHHEVTAYGFSGEGVALTQDGPPPQGLSRPTLT